MATMNIPSGMRAAYFTINQTFVAAGFYANNDDAEFKSPYFTRLMAKQICDDLVREKQIEGYTLTDQSITIRYTNYRDNRTKTYFFETIDGIELIRLGSKSWAWSITYL